MTALAYTSNARSRKRGFDDSGVGTFGTSLYIHYPGFLGHTNEQDDRRSCNSFHREEPWQSTLKNRRRTAPWANYGNVTQRRWTLEMKLPQTWFKTEAKSSTNCMSNNWVLSIFLNTWKTSNFQKFPNLTRNFPIKTLDKFFFDRCFQSRLNRYNGF